MDVKRISVTILVRNAEATIGECLASVAAFGEIIVLENGSTDGTLDGVVEFARRHGRVHIHHHDFIGFGPLKNLAAARAHNDWILSLDADEVLEPECLEHIRILDLDPDEVGAISRRNLYRGEWIRACGWSPDYVQRLFNRTTVGFTDAQVHECLALQPRHRVICLKGHLRHYAFDGIAALLDKLQRYSTLWAEQNLDHEVSVLSALTHAQWSFLRCYLLQKGIAYGFRGLVISLCNSLGVLFKYFKLYEIKHTPPRSVSLIISTYNQKERLALVLDSVRTQLRLPDEVIVADDGSRPDTRQLLETLQADFPCPLRHVWQEDRGFRLAGIRNKALRAARGEYIIVIDGDMILERHFIGDHLRRAVPGQYLQGSRILLSPGDTELIERAQSASGPQGQAYRLAFGARSCRAHRIAPLSALIYRYSLRRAGYFMRHDLIRGVRGCNCSFYLRDAGRCGYYDEGYEGWGREDSDFAARFVMARGVFRRLKFQGLAYHLHQEERSRERDAHNMERYLEMVRDYRSRQSQ